MKKTVAGLEISLEDIIKLGNFAKDSGYVDGVKLCERLVLKKSEIPPEISPRSTYTFAKEGIRIYVDGKIPCLVESNNNKYIRHGEVEVIHVGHSISGNSYVMCRFVNFNCKGEEVELR